MRVFKEELISCDREHLEKDTASGKSPRSHVFVGKSADDRFATTSNLRNFESKLRNHDGRSHARLDGRN